MKRLIDRAGWALAGALGLALVLVAARAIQAGPLDPPGPVGSTMKTIGDLVPSWHQTLASSGCGSPRWSCVMGGAAVLDNETGLVWEKTPNFATPTESWFDSETLCTSLTTGGRFGWRMPTAEELLSLKDPASFPEGLPAGHPFTGLVVDSWWTATSDPVDEESARYINFSSFGSSEQTAPKGNAALASIWCVRGGHGFDPQTPSDNSWSRVLSASSGADSCHSPRFTCVLGNEAALDHETGLVWQRDPTANASGDWAAGSAFCYFYYGGARHGWRTATVAELTTLLDESNISPTISLPTGHPFLNMYSINYSTNFWASTEVVGSPGQAYAILLFGPVNGQPGALYQVQETGIGGYRPWCVRGPESGGG